MDNGNDRGNISNKQIVLAVQSIDRERLNFLIECHGIETDIALPSHLTNLKSNPLEN